MTKCTICKKEYQANAVGISKYCRPCSKQLNNERAKEYKRKKKLFEDKFYSR